MWQNRLILLGVLVVGSGGAIAGVVWWRSPERHLAIIRAAPESLSSFSLLERLATRYPDHPEILFRSGQALRRQGHASAARQRLLEAQDHGWPTASVQHELVLADAWQHFTRVEPILRGLLDANPDDDEVLLALALGWSRQQAVSKGEAYVNSVLARHPEDGLALCIRGRLRLQKGQPHAARPELEAALKQSAGKYYYPEARLLLANCLLEMGEFESSLALYQAASQEEPTNPRPWFGIGRCAWHLDRWAEADQAFETVLRLDPHHLDALSQRAYFAEEQGELARAVEFLQTAVEQDPTWYDLHFRMAKLYRALGQPEAAIEHQRRAEAAKQAYARPRQSGDAEPSSYTGEGARPPRTAERGPLEP